jgi:hypothetical protein
MNLNTISWPWYARPKKKGEKVSTLEIWVS